MSSFDGFLEFLKVNIAGLGKMGGGEILAL